ncbi:MAG: hypothetical protein RR653_09615 [Clostridia bacterium]
MDNPKLKLMPQKYTGESTVISMRIPREMLQELDFVAKETRRTRNDLLSVCLEFALKNIEIVNQENKEDT